MNNLNAGKVIKMLEHKRNDVNFMAYKILSIMLSQYETRLEKDLTNESPIVYNARKPIPDLYNKFDLDNLTRSNGKFNIQSRTFYYMTIIQVLDQMVFGINGVNISITKSNSTQNTSLSVPRKLMDEKYELIKILVHNVKPFIDSTRLKKNKKNNNAGNKYPHKNVIINDEIIVPLEKVTLELEDTSQLPTVL